MRCHVKLEGSKSEILKVDDIANSLESAENGQLSNLPEYIRTYNDPRNGPKYYVITFFENSRHGLLTLNEKKKLCKYDLWKNSYCDGYIPRPCHHEYGLERIVNEKGVLIEGNKSIFLSTPIPENFTENREFNIPLSEVFQEDEIAALQSLAPVFTQVHEESGGEGEEDWKFTPYQGSSSLSLEQQQRLYYEPVIPGSDRFFVTLRFVIENYDEPLRMLSAVFLNDQALEDLQLSIEEKKYIETYLMPFFTPETISRIDNLPGIKIGDVYQFFCQCIAERINKINPGFLIEENKKYKLSKKIMDAQVGELSLGHEEKRYWAIHRPPVDPIFLSPNKEILEAVGSFIGINLRNSLDQIDFIRETLDRYNAEEIKHISNALSDYLNTLNDSENKKHFRQEYQVAYHYLSYSYPIESIIHPYNFEYFSDLRDLVSVKISLQNILRLAMNQVDARLEVFNIASDCVIDPSRIISEGELERLITHLPCESLKSLLEENILDKCVNLLSRNSYAFHMKNTLHSKNEAIKLRVFFKNFFEILAKKEKLVAFFELLSGSVVKCLIEYISIDQLVDAVKSIDDFSIVIRHLDRGISKEIISAVLHKNSIDSYVNKTDDIVMTLSYFDRRSEPKLRRNIFNLLKGSIKKYIIDERSLRLIFKCGVLTGSEAVCVFGLIRPVFKSCFGDCESFKNFIGDNNVDYTYRKMFISALVSDSIFKKIINGIADFNFIISTISNFSGFEVAYNFFIDMQEKIPAIINSANDFICLFTSDKVSEIGKSLFFDALQMKLLKILGDTDQFLELLTHNFLIDEYKRNICLTIFENYNERFRRGQQEDSGQVKSVPVFLSGLYLIQNKFMTITAIEFENYIKTISGSYVSSLESLEEDVLSWINRHNLYFQASFKQAVTTYVAQWRLGSAPCLIDKICQEARSNSITLRLFDRAPVPNIQNETVDTAFRN